MEADWSVSFASGRSVSSRKRLELESPNPGRGRTAANFVGLTPSTGHSRIRFPVLDVERTYRSCRLIIRQGLWTENRIRAANGGLQA